MNISSHVFIDIETIPSQEPWVREYADQTVKPPGTLKKQETIDNWILNERADAVEEAIDKMGFDGSTNHIICIGVAIGENPVVSFDVRDLTEERQKIAEFYAYVAAQLNGKMPFIVGHNVVGFDMKVIRQRSIVLRLPRPMNFPWMAKPWDNNPFDTMVQWSGGNKDFIKLDRLARAFGLPGKDGMDGSKVYQAWKDGRIDEIAAYCRDDVEMTRAVFKHWHGIP